MIVYNIYLQESLKKIIAGCILGNTDKVINIAKDCIEKINKCNDITLKEYEHIL